MNSGEVKAGENIVQFEFLLIRSRSVLSSETRFFRAARYLATIRRHAPNADNPKIWLFSELRSKALARKQGDIRFDADGGISEP